MKRSDIDHLLEACGVRSPLTLDIERPQDHLVDSVSLDFPFATIGRIGTNHLTLDHEQVSRRHAYIQVINGRIFCVDFKSRTGTHWDGGSGSGWLADGQCVRMGPFTIRPHELVRNDGARWPESIDLTDPLHSLSAELDTLPPLTLQFIQGVREKSDWPMQRVLALVGGARKCKVQLVDPRVSRYHCSLLRTPIGAWVIDLMGRGGVFVNGTRVRFALLRNGDQLRVGGVKMRVECENPGGTAGPGMTGNGAAAPNAGSAGPLVPVGPSAGELVPQGALPIHYTMGSRPLTTEVKLSEQESLVNTLIYHFGQVQQQMAEQFNQAVMTMVQMFSTFHRDQMGLVRAELDRLHALNQEILDIQRELSRQHSQRSHAPALEDQSAEASDEPASPTPQGAPRREPTRQARPAEPAAEPVSPAPAPVSAGEAAPPLEPSSTAMGATPPPGEDVHAWLCKRMEMIRAEQQTLWQKILTTVRSTVSGGP